MIQIDWQSRTPVYEQLIQGIVRLKSFGILSPGEQLPSVRAMASDIGVNPNTVQKAYQALEARGIIYSVTGKGSFISPNESIDEEILKEAENRVGKTVREAAQMGLPKERVVRVVDTVYAERSMSE